MTREEAIMVLKMVEAHGLADEAKRMAIEALSADAVSREEAIQAIDRCRERKNKEIEQLRELYSQKPTIPMFKESEEAYKAWTGEEMGKTHGRLIDADALIERMPSVMDMQDTYLPIHFKEWLIDEAPTISADRPHGEWIVDTYNMELKCGICGEIFRFDDVDELLDYKEYAKFCLACGAKMGGDGE